MRAQWVGGDGEVRRVLTRSSNPRRFLTAQEISRVEAAVAEAEANTSGQIKVVLARHCWLGLARKAHKLFSRFGLDQTAGRNCVMILLITTNRQFLVYGDLGIHAHVGAEFWKQVRDVMEWRFRSAEFAEGLSEAVREVGWHLAEQFPREAGGNELSNRIEYAR